MTAATRQIVIATWLGIIVNVILTFAKAFVGFIAHSQALLADAAHSASDIVGSVVALFGVKIASNPPDDDHPYGHGKAEHVASIIVALLLLVIGVQVAVSSIKIFFGPPPTAPGRLALPIVIASVVIKELMFHYKKYVGRKHNSSVLIAEAWHHRSDAFSSLAALIGVVTALIGARLEFVPLLYGDAAAGLVVSVIIIHIGFRLARKSSNVVMEQVLDETEVQQYTNTALLVDGVMQVDQLHARSHGRYIIIDIKLSVDAYITVEDGHNIGRNVKDRLCTAHPEVADVLVHVNPYG